MKDTDNIIYLDKEQYDMLTELIKKTLFYIDYDLYRLDNVVKIKYNDFLNIKDFMLQIGIINNDDIEKIKEDKDIILKLKN